MKKGKLDALTPAYRLINSEIFMVEQLCYQECPYNFLWLLDMYDFHSEQVHLKHDGAQLLLQFCLSKPHDACDATT